MRIFTASFLALLIATAIACNKDDDDDGNNTPTTEEKVEGEWEMREYEGEYEEEDTSSANDASVTSTGSNFSGSVVFDANNSFQSDLSFDVTTVIESGGSVIDSSTTTVQDLQGMGTWSVEGNNQLMIVILGNTDTTSMEIISLTSNEMVLREVAPRNFIGIDMIGETEMTFNKK